VRECEDANRNREAGNRDEGEGVMAVLGEAGVLGARVERV